MGEHFINKKYNDVLCFALWRYRQIKRESKTNPDSAKLLQDMKPYIRNAARALRRIGTTSGDVIIYDKHGDEYGEGYTIIYKELYGFVGTKQEFIDYLWEVHATRITSPYDCTGQHFTTGWKVARVADNLWKVAECVGVDV